MTGKQDSAIDVYVKAAMGRKAFGIVVLDVHDLTSIADVIIICSGKSSRQVSAIAEFVRTDLKTHDIHPLNIEGMQDGRWVLLDYGHVIIHVFYEPVRNFYDLEGIWVDAGRIKTDSLINREKAQQDTENDGE